MTVTDTLTVELTYVHEVDDLDELMDEKQYESFYKTFDGMGADDAHVKSLKHFVSEGEVNAL